MKAVNDIKLYKILHRVLGLLKTHTHTPDDVGAVSWTLLWALSDENVTINGEGKKEFAEQTISVDLSGYDGIKIIRSHHEPIELYRLTDGNFPYYSMGGAVDWINSNQFGVVIRQYEVADDSIKFYDCQQFNYVDSGKHFSTTLNTSLIPIEIYGIKGLPKSN